MRLYRSPQTISIVSSVCALWSTPVFAGPNARFQEFHTYGGTIGVISEAFNRLALICNHQNFPALFLGVAALGVVLGGIYSTFKNLAESRFSFTAWFLWMAPLILGLPFYAAYIANKDEMYFTDETTGEMATVSGIPDGIITIAGFFNSVEYNLIEMVDSTSLAGTKYRDMAGGQVFSLISNFFTGDINEDEFPDHLKKSLDAYITDCVFYEAMRPGGQLNPGDFERPAGAIMMTLLGMAQNPAVFTKWYDDVSGTTGEHVCNCQEAWIGDGGSNPGLLNAIMDPNTFKTQAYLIAQCNASGFDATDSAGNPDAAVIAQCELMMRRSLGRIMTRGNNTTIAGDAMDNLARNRLIAGTMVNALTKLDKTDQMRLVANFSFTKDGIGVGMIANDYIPLVKAVILAIFLGIMPFLVIFIPTPIGGKALSVIIGAFCFITAWGVADAVLTSFTVDYAYDKFGDIASSGINLSNMLLIPNRAMRVLTMFGYMRMSSIMFAGLISTMLIRFGGMFLSGIAHNITGRIGSAGAEAGGMLDPVKQSNMMSGYTQAPATMEAYRDTTSQQGGFNSMVSGIARQQSVTMTQGIEGAHATYDAQGDLGGVGHVAYNNSRMQGAQAKGAADTMDNAARASGVPFGALIDDAGQKMGANKTGETMGAASVFQSPNEAANLGQNKGAYTSAKDKGFFGFLERQGTNPGEFGMSSGEIGAWGETAGVSSQLAIGRDAIQSQISQGNWDKASRNALQLAAYENATTGKLSDGTKRLLSGINNNPSGQAALVRNATVDMATDNGMSHQLNHQAQDAGLGDPGLSGNNKVSATYAVQDDGSLHLVDMNAGKGWMSSRQAFARTRIGQDTHIGNDSVKGSRSWAGSSDVHENTQKDLVDHSNQSNVFSGVLPDGTKVEGADFKKFEGGRWSASWNTGSGMHMEATGQGASRTSSRVSFGGNMNPQDAFQSAAAGIIPDAAFSDGKFRANYAAAVASGMHEIYAQQQQGQTTTMSDAHARAGLSIGVAGGGLDYSEKGLSTDLHTQSKMAADINNILSKAAQDPASRSQAAIDVQKYVNERMSSPVMNEDHHMILNKTGEKINQSVKNFLKGDPDIEPSGG